MGIFKADDVSGESLVSDSGAIAIPLIGEVKAAGPTVRELGDTIQTKLQTGGYFRDPKVSIQILTYRPVYVFGEAGKPGEYPYEQGVTVRNAVALAGGYTHRANEDYVVVTRGNQDFKGKIASRLLPVDVVRAVERYC